MIPSIREDGRSVIFDVQVVPRASRNRLGPVMGERIKVQLTAPPVDGEANRALIEFLAGAFGVPRAQVSIVRGLTSRRKTVCVVGATASALHALL